MSTTTKLSSSWDDIKETQILPQFVKSSKQAKKRNKSGKREKRSEALRQRKKIFQTPPKKSVHKN